MKIDFPYGKSVQSLEISESRLQGVLLSKLQHYTPAAAPVELVEEALRNPIDSKPLWELAQGKQKIVLMDSPSPFMKGIGGQFLDNQLREKKTVVVVGIEKERIKYLIFWRVFIN